MVPMSCRAISFAEGHFDAALLRLASECGFNAAEFQTERGCLAPLRQLAADVQQAGFVGLCQSLGMRIGVWVHELEDYDPEYGSIELGNHRLWEAIDQKYDRILKDIIPWADYLILTVVETANNVASEPALLLKLVQVINDRCRVSGKKLALRSFVWDPTELEAMKEILMQIPDDIDVMTKCVPQDWQMRSVPDPLLGKIPGRRQLVESDIAGEYYRMDCVANCFTGLLAKQYEYWCGCGCDGLSVRISRKWRTGPFEGEYCSVLNQAQEVNLWYLGFISSGKALDEDEVWRLYTNHAFGRNAAALMEKTLRFTGEVIAEALHVGMLPMGDNKCFVPDSFSRVMRGYQGSNDPRYPAPANRQTAAVRYEDEEDRLFRNPFHLRYSPFIWDSGLCPEYQATRRGNPEIIARKEREALRAVQLADDCLNDLIQAKEYLPESAFEFFEFKLQENQLLIRSMTQIALAWLKAERRLYAADCQERAELKAMINGHLQALEQLKERCGKTKNLVYNGRPYRLISGIYLDIATFRQWFTDYFNP
jgi:hypothetical protein